MYYEMGQAIQGHTRIESTRKDRARLGQDPKAQLGHLGVAPGGSFPVEGEPGRRQGVLFLCHQLVLLDHQLGGVDGQGGGAGHILGQGHVARSETTLLGGRLQHDRTDCRPPGHQGNNHVRANA